MKKTSLSVIIPVFNEEENIGPLYKSLSETLRTCKLTYEIIFVDDGSLDNGFSILEQLSRKDRRTRAIHLSHNYGQTAAISAGIDQSRGSVIVLMDGDCQNDPKDIPLLLKKLKEGYDVVSGWRKNRKDFFITRQIPSMIANKLISKITGVPLHDYGCTLKAYRSEVLKRVQLYGEMHRFIPAWVYWAGGRITELPVRHYPRIHGTTKYGLNRTFKVILDLLTLKLLSHYATKPIYFFGSTGMILIFLSFLAGGETLVEKAMIGTYVHRNPFILMAVFLAVVGFQFILLGLLAELLIRIYHELHGRVSYHINRIVP